ncbi:phage replication initiation protein, NGO0469 family [Rhodohalobacter sp. 8-1]|uniref:phage replication initiation protein, NGO0469 family n=1 Tax=Rhodohalobacter sp. 8-1 TaxID=3131972 RepID=UPI0030EB9676
MSDLIITEDPSNYPVPDEGLHSAVLVDAVNLGTLETPWGPKEKISLIFELQSTDEDGRHFIVGKRFTRSMNEKASLRKFLEKWRSIKYTPAELQQGVDLENLIGMSSLLLVVLNETQERTYANIESILPYKNRHGDIDHFALQPSGEYIRVIHREGYKEPEKYAEAVNGQQG